MRLIELVRENPSIFDTAHPDHSNSTITEVIWEQISEELEEDCK